MQMREQTNVLPQKTPLSKNVTTNNNNLIRLSCF